MLTAPVFLFSCIIHIRKGLNSKSAVSLVLQVPIFNEIVFCQLICKLTRVKIMALYWLLLLTKTVRDMSILVERQYPSMNLWHILSTKELKFITVTTKIINELLWWLSKDWGKNQGIRN